MPINPNSRRKNNNPMMGRADPSRPLTALELRQNELGARFQQNASLLERNRRTNLLARDRHGVEMRDTTNGQGLGMKDSERERAKAIMNTNSRLQIKPGAIDPTKEVTGDAKLISKGFKVLDNYLNNQTDSLDNTFVRGEVARLTALASKAGNDALADSLDDYLTNFSKNDKLSGRNFVAATGMLRSMQADIRNAFDVDMLFELTDGNVRSALPPGYRIGPDGQLYEHANSTQRARVREESNRYEEDFFNSNFGERGALTQEEFDRFTEIRLERQRVTAKEEDAYWEEVGKSSLPYWAT